MVKVLYVLSVLVLVSCAAAHQPRKADSGEYYEITPVESHPLNQDH
jgi:hypothetical protein